MPAVTTSENRPADPVKPVAHPASSSTKPATDVKKTAAALKPPTEPKPNRDGQRSLTRELGLKISRIVEEIPDTVDTIPERLGRTA